MRPIILVSAAILFALSSMPNAVAADIPARVVTKAPVVVPAYNWTGCYVGGNVGGAWGSSNVNIPLYPSNFDIDNSGFAGGGHVGCNYMFQSRWVIGIEGDYTWTDLEGDSSTITGPLGERFSVKWDALATVRGRLGYGWNNNLFYVTGGGAWANLDSAQYLPLAGGSRSGTFGGWVVGGGFEHAINMSKWIIGIEYLYADVGGKDFFFLGPTSISHTVNVVRGRLSYKF